MITGKASGALRQEYHDLELLDEITKLHYLGQLPSLMNGGDRCNTLIHEFRLHKGMDYVPSTVHSSIKWSKKDPMLDPIPDNLPWMVVTKESIPSLSTKMEMCNVTATGPPKSNKRKQSTQGTEHHILIWDLCSALALAVAILDALALEMVAYRCFGFGGMDFGWNCFGALSASMPKNLISYVYCSVSKKLHKHRCCKLECCFTSMIIYMLLI
jgi:hypothetical protein